jgi:hypothetical protein
MTPLSVGPGQPTGDDVGTYLIVSQQFTGKNTALPICGIIGAEEVTP